MGCDCKVIDIIYHMKFNMVITVSKMLQSLLYVVFCMSRDCARVSRRHQAVMFAKLKILKKTPTLLYSPMGSTSQHQIKRVLIAMGQTTLNQSCS